MTLNIPEKRQHTMTHQPDYSRVEIEEPYGTTARWSVSFEARRTAQAVEVRILDRLVVRFMPEKALEFGKALVRVSSR